MFDPSGTVPNSRWSPIGQIVALSGERERWYASQVALPSGDVLVVAGLKQEAPTRVNNYTHQIFSSTEMTFGQAYDINQSWYYLADEYPRLFLVTFLSGGQLASRVISVGPRQIYWDGVYTGQVAQGIFELNPASPSSWTRNQTHDLYVFDNSEDPIPQERHDGAYALLPNPNKSPQNAGEQALNRILAVGGRGKISRLHVDPPNNTNEDIAHASAELIDYAQQKRYLVGELEDGSERRHCHSVVLPNGNVFVFGGASDLEESGTDPVLSTWMYTPDSGVGSFTQMANMPDDDYDENNLPDGTRMYHSSALLLPSGQVYAAGTAYLTYMNPFPTIYTPPYLLDENGEPAERPTISIVVSQTSYGPSWEFPITYTMPENRSIDSVVLMRPGSSTHSYDMEQRLVRLKWTTQGQPAGRIMAYGPYDPAIAPPGYYMLFLVDSTGCYSQAAWIQIVPESEMMRQGENQ